MKIYSAMIYDASGRTVVWREWPYGISKSEAQRLVMEDYAGLGYGAILYRRNGTVASEGRYTLEMED